MLQRRAGVGGEGQVGASCRARERGKKRNSRGGVQPPGCEEVSGGVPGGGAPGNPFLLPGEGPGPNYTPLSLPSLPSATLINLKLEAWLLQSLSWGWQEGWWGALEVKQGSSHVGGPVCKASSSLGERRKAFPSPASP